MQFTFNNESIAKCELAIRRHSEVIKNGEKALEDLNREILASLHFIVTCEDSDVGLTHQMATDYSMCKMRLTLLHTQHKYLTNCLEEKKTMGEFLESMLEHLFSKGSETEWNDRMRECSDRRVELMRDSVALRADVVRTQAEFDESIRGFPTGVCVHPL